MAKKTQVKEVRLQLTKVGLLVFGRRECPACHDFMVWSLDDRYDKKSEIGSLFNAEPDPQGFAVLWYEVDRHDVPLNGRQWFRIPEPNYTGPLWSRHDCAHPASRPITMPETEGKTTP